MPPSAAPKRTRPYEGPVPHIRGGPAVRSKNANDRIENSFSPPAAALGSNAGSGRRGFFSRSFPAPDALPGLCPYLQSGIDSFRDSGRVDSMPEIWMRPPAPAETPGFLCGPDTAEFTRECKRLVEVATAPGSLRKVLSPKPEALRSEHVPEALRPAVQSTRFGCSRLRKRRLFTLGIRIPPRGNLPPTVTVTRGPMRETRRRIASRVSPVLTLQSALTARADERSQKARAKVSARSGSSDQNDLSLGKIQLFAVSLSASTSHLRIWSGNKTA